MPQTKDEKRRSAIERTEAGIKALKTCLENPFAGLNRTALEDSIRKAERVILNTMKAMKP